MKKYRSLLVGAVLALVLGVLVQPFEFNQSARDALRIKLKAEVQKPVNSDVRRLLAGDPRPDLAKARAGEPTGFFLPQERQALVALNNSDPRVVQSVLSRRAITVDFAVLETVRQKGDGFLEIDAGDRGILKAKVGQVMQNWGGGYSLSGGVVGYPLGTFLATIHEQSMVAMVRLGDGSNRDLEILQDPRGQHEIREVDHSKMPTCDGVLEAPKDDATEPHPQAPKAATENAPMAMVVTAADDGSVIDVMVVYTSAARTSRGGTSAMTAAINQTINESNQAFQGSNISASLRLAHAAEISYSETTDSEMDLSRLRGKTDGYIDMVHTLRNTYAADMVSLWTQSDYSGIGYLMSSLSNSFESSAFNVCDVDYAVGSYTLTHECGHNMGCAHDRANSSGSGLYSYSFGWRWNGTNGTQYRSIMAYNPGTRVLRFSNPSVSYNGGVTGTSSDDNARSINNAKTVVSNWRQAPVSSTLTLSPTSTDASATGGSGSFNVTASGTWSWSLSGGAGWCSSTQVTTQSGNKVFSFALQPNTASTSRTASFIFTSGSISRTHSVTQQGSAVDDHGDSTGTATLIAQNSTTSGNIGTAGDNDYFRINVSGTGTLVVTTTGSTDTYGHLLNSAGTELASNDDDSTTNFRISYAVTTGTYYVRVRHFNSTGTGAYQLLSSSTSSSTLTIDPARSTVISAGGTLSFDVFSNATWSWSDNASWVNSTEATTQSGNQLFLFTVDANTASTVRTATITLVTGGLSVTHTISQAGTSADDHGNSTATATVVGQNSTTNGNIETAGDNDYFRINVTTAGTLVATTTGSIDTYGYLLSSSGVELASNDDDTTSNFRLSYSVSPGTYYVRVRHFSSSSTGIYQLVCSMSASVVFGVSPSSSSFTSVTGSGSFEVTASGAWNWSDNASWVNSSEAVNQSGNQTFSFSVEANTAGTRTAVITLTTDGQTVTHTIIQAAGGGGDDHGNSTGTATLMAQNAMINGSIETAGDNDYFRINVSAAGTLVIYTTGTTDTYGYLLDSMGSQLAFNDDFEGNNFRISAAVSVGTYYIRVRHYNSNFTGSYQLTTSHSASASMVSVSPPTSSTGAAGGTVNFSVTSTVTWSWTSNAAWVSSSEAVNQSGTQAFTCTVGANPTSSTRTAILTFTSASGTATHLIQQSGNTGGDDHGNSTELATLISPNTTIDGNIETEGDHDYFRIDTPVGGNFSVFSTGSIDTHGTLFSATGAQLASNDDSSGLNFGITRRITAGTYYVRVRHYVSSGTGVYQLVTTMDGRTLLRITRVVPLQRASVPNQVGTMLLKASPRNAATALKGGDVEQTAEAEPGTLIDLRATAKAGYLFSHWQGVPSDGVYAGNNLSFTCPDQESVAIRAVFIENPLASIFGSRPVVFQGLLQAQNALDLTNDTVAQLTATLSPARGTLSGKILHQGRAVSFTAVLQGDGNVWFKVGSYNAASQLVLGQPLTLTWSENGLALQMQGPNGEPMSGFARRHRAPSTAAVSVTGSVAAYTVVFPSKTQVPAKPASSYPQGYGYGTLSMNKNGILKLSGQLADGMKITASSYLVSDGEACLFVQLPSPGSNVKRGSLMGVMAFDAQLRDSDVTAVDLIWFRPTVVQGSNPATQLYSDGWPGGLRLDMIGARYDGALSVQSGLRLAETSNLGNAQMEFLQGGLSAPVLIDFNVVGSKLLKLDTRDASYTLYFTQKTGLLRGNFTPNWSLPSSKKPAFQGVILQKGLNLGGYGFFLGNASGNLDPESGGVELYSR